jgi:hypothetical protein
MRFKLKYFYTILYIYICVCGRSQNMVPNGNFEVHFDCTFSLVESSTPWCGVNPVAYLNACISHPYYSVPSQSFSPGYPSYQNTHSGDAYATFGFLLPLSPTTPSRYPHIPLIDTLEAGKMYCVTYYVSLWNDCKYSADKLGALFTTVPFDCTVGNQNLYTGYTPQVVSTPGVLYDDTLGWQEVSGTFTATGTEAYLTIGNFFPNAAHTYSISYPGGVRNLAEYYLDDVSVEEVEVVKARNDTSIVLGDSIVVGVNLGEANLYNWQPTAGLSCTNCPNPKASPNSTTTYTVTKTQCKVTTTDVITVSVSPTSVKEFGMTNGDLRVLPNPTNGIITISSRFEMQKIEVINIPGQILLSETVNDKSFQIQLQDFSAGIYFVRIIYPNGLSIVKKVIVNH